LESLARGESRAQVEATLDSHRLAHAFLALGDDVAAAPVRRSLQKAVVAGIAAFALATAAPVSWFAPAKSHDQPAATVAGSKAWHLADEDEAGN
jgi:hypothetical protein